MSLRIFVKILLILGVVFFTISLFLTYYNDPDAENILRNYYSDRIEYYKKESELSTYKLKFMDLGLGIVIASSIILLFFITTNTKTLSDLNKLQTLNKVRIFILSNLIWLLHIPSTYWYYHFRAARGDYPIFADSIGIPIMLQLPAFYYALIPLNAFLLFTMFKSKLPTILFVKAKKYSTIVVLWELFFSFWLLLNILCLLILVTDGDHFSIGICLFFTFILLSLRAGQIGKYN
jgi:hypothetical protein